MHKRNNPLIPDPVGFNHKISQVTQHKCYFSANGSLSDQKPCFSYANNTHLNSRHIFSSMLHLQLPFGFSKTPRVTITMSIRQKSSGGRRPKKKTYHRVLELDRVMELHKKPSMILQLKSLIQSQPRNSPLLIRDLEKNVGFVRKWAFKGLIQKHPAILRVGGIPLSVSLTERAQWVAQEESQARLLMEPILVTNLKKLLMLSVGCRVPLETIDLVGPELGLPFDFKECLIPKYPQFFSVCLVRGREFLLLEDWDSTLAVIAREARYIIDSC